VAAGVEYTLCKYEVRATSWGETCMKEGQGCDSDRPGQAGELGRQEPHVFKKK